MYTDLLDRLFHTNTYTPHDDPPMTFTRRRGNNTGASQCDCGDCARYSLIIC